MDLNGVDLITGVNLAGARFGGALNLASATLDNLKGADLSGEQGRAPPGRWGPNRPGT